MYFWLLNVFSGQFCVVFALVFKASLPIFRSVAFVLYLVDRLAALDTLLEPALAFRAPLAPFDPKFSKHALH